MPYFLPCAPRPVAGFGRGGRQGSRALFREGCPRRGIERGSRRPALAEGRRRRPARRHRRVLQAPPGPRGRFSRGRGARPRRRDGRRLRRNRRRSAARGCRPMRRGWFRAFSTAFAAPLVLFGLILTGACRTPEETRSLNFDPETTTGALGAGWDGFEKTELGDTFVDRKSTRL